MDHFQEASLEECVKELADRLTRDVQGMTPLQSHDYFLCHSIDTLVFMQSTEAPARRHSNECALSDPHSKAPNILPFRKRG